MTDSVARLKELLFDRETATLSEIARRIEDLAAAEEKARAELAAADRNLEARFAARLDSATAANEKARADLAASDLKLETSITARLEELSGIVAATRTLHDELARRLSTLDQRAGTPEALRSSVAAVFDDVILEARETKQENVSRALAPMMVKTIKAEIRNNQAELVEALYPITGQLVKAYVSAAIKDLTSRMNRGLQSNAFMLRVRSIFSGYSIAELALAETQQLDVEELYLIRRGSGELLQRWPANTFRANSDIHMSGVMSAINDFAADAFQSEGGGQLRSFNLDDATVYLRASPVYLLAARCRGTAVPGVDSLLDSEFLAAVARQHALESKEPAGSTGQTVHANLLADLKTRLESGIAERHEALSSAGMPFSPARAIGALAMLAIAAGIGWFTWMIWQEEATRSKARATIAEVTEMRGFPVILDVARGGGTLAISGVAPTAATRTTMMSRLGDALPGVKIEDRGIAAMPAIPAMPVIPPPARDVTPDIEAVRRSLAALEAETARSSQLVAIRRSLDRAEQRLSDALPDIAAWTARLPEARRASGAEVETSVRRLLAEIRERHSALQQGLPDTADRTAAGETLQRSANTLREIARLVSIAPEATSTAAPLQASQGTRQPPDLARSAEEVALAAERLATSASATLQTALLSIPPHPTPLDRLREYTRVNAIFFANNEDYRDAKASAAVIDNIVRLAGQTNALIRVVGYTDERGAQTRNAPLAQSRADKVLEALVAKGMPRARLVAVGRSTGPDLSPIVGLDSPNRRVEFEIGYAQEIPAGGR